MNKAIIIGRVGKDATVNAVNGKNVINVPVAVSETWKDKSGEKQEKTTWFNVALWRENTAVATYLKKGTQVMVEGSIDVRTYQKADGNSGFSLELKAQNLELLGGGKETENKTGEKSDAPVAGNTYEELPF